MSLRESVARSKDKWKKRLYLGSRMGNPTPPGVNNEPAAPSPEPDNQPAKSGMAWSGVKALNKVLESSSDVFGPLKSAIGGLNKCIDIYERASKGRKDYDELREKLDDLLTDLAGHMAQPMDPMMTNGVKLLCRGIEAEVKKVEQKQVRNMGQRLLDAMDTSEEILECYRRINGHVERLMLNANMSILKTINELTTEARLKGISPATSAIYDSTESDDIKRKGCTPGTRQPQIDLLLEWTHDPESGRTCWMNGMAGTGKTTIAHSVCSSLEQVSALGASFFCSRVIPECRQVKHIIPTIAYQLSRYSLPFRFALDQILQLNPDARTRSLKTQYQKLIVEPLEVKGSLPTDFIVVIDALDECENEESLGQILDLILSPTIALPIRFLLSSRPEPEINRKMAHRVHAQDGSQLVLRYINADAVKSDIETYMRHELEHVPLTDSQWSSLIERCGVLFIYASTACRLVKQGHEMKTLNEAIGVIVGSASASAHEDENPIDELYSMILTAAFNKSRMSEANRRRMRELLETVICAIEPMTLDTFATLLGLEGVEQANALLQPLRSVLNVTAIGFVTTLHASFPDFMLSFGRSAEFHCVAASRHTALAESCIQIIDGVETKFNICGLSSSHLSDDEVESIEKRVDQAISPGLIYACQYWSTHLYLGGERQELVAIVHKFFSERLLLWMEILNLTKRMRFGTSVIRDAEKWCQNSVIPDNLTKLARDAGEFVSVYANHPISQSTPHIYVSMLAFWPRSRPVSIAYIPKTTGILEPTGTGIARRKPTLLATWRVSSSGVHSMNLSSDGSRIVAATKDAIDLLDTSTGDGVIHIQGPQTQDVQALAMSPDATRIAFGGNSGLYLLDVRTETIEEVFKPSSIVLSIAFSPDGFQFASGLSDGNIHVYPTQKGNLVLDPLKGHTHYVTTVAFSPNGLFLASGSLDGSIRIWNVNSGQTIGNPLQGHTGGLLSVSYSPNGTHLASASRDTTIRVWDLVSGQTVLGLEVHSNWVHSVTFSPDGAFIASGSADNTTRVYDAKTGQAVLGPLEGHTECICSVIFSPDGTQLFSCSNKGIIRLWNVQVIGAPNSSQPDFPNDFRSVRYSPDGLRVVSGSSKGGICLCDVQTGEIILGPLQGHSTAVWCVDFSPNNAYIASASADSTLRIWSAQDGRDLHGPIQGHTDPVNSVRFSTDGSLLVSGSEDRTVQVWDMTSGQSVIEPLEGHSSPVYSVAFSPNGSLVVSGSDDRTIRVWDIKTGQTVVGPLQGHEQQIRSVEFSPDSSQILSGSWDSCIRTWDAQTGQSLLVWGKDQKMINSVSFSPDGLLVASGSDDKTTRIWDAKTGDLKLILEGHSKNVRSVQFSPDGLYVVSGSDDGTIRFWDVSSRIANLQLNRSNGPEDLDTFIDPVLSPWSLDSSGWLVDQRQQRLVWVPDDLRISMPRHPNDLVICKYGSLKLNFDGINIGERWMGCYHP
ncbi:hypothetical protein RSAG8_11026, partial [Rhizoctonia solani AG-8 WAC10335]